MEKKNWKKNWKKKIGKKKLEKKNWKKNWKKKIEKINRFISQMVMASVCRFIAQIATLDHVHQQICLHVAMASSTKIDDVLLIY